MLLDLKGYDVNFIKGIQLENIKLVFIILWFKSKRKEKKKKNNLLYLDLRQEESNILKCI